MGSDRAVIDDIHSWWTANAEAGRTSVLFCYTIGKAQRLLAELRRVTDRVVYVHGMMLGMIETYRQCGVEMLPVDAGHRTHERPQSKAASFAGELVLAPLSARGTPWMRRLGDISDAFASGLMRVSGVRRQRGYDRGFVFRIMRTGRRCFRQSRKQAPAASSPPMAMPNLSPAICRSTASRAGVIRTAWEGEPTGD